ncbi:hypothetical protein RsTz2092_06140 [Deferribacterales bacterium RsTz2092]|nr:hypothetical protein AGMMS49941_03010 [Deferribacterales bacterium]
MPKKTDILNDNMRDLMRGGGGELHSNVVTPRKAALTNLLRGGGSDFAGTTFAEHEEYLMEQIKSVSNSDSSDVSNNMVKEVERNLLIMHLLAHSLGRFIHEEYDQQRLKILFLLHHIGQERLKVLAENMGMSTSNLCIVLDKLEKDGFVARRTDEKDRRNRYYAITAQGLEELDRCRQEMRGVMAKMFASLELDEREIVYKAYHELNNVLQKYAYKLHGEHTE